MSLSVIQTASNSSTGSPTTTVTFSALTAGSALLIIGTYPGGNGTIASSITGVGGGTWTEALAANYYTPTFLPIEYWVSLNVSGGATSVTVTHSSSYGLKTITVIEVGTMVTSGTSTDGTNSTNYSGHAAPITSGVITPSAGVDILLVSACSTSGRTISSQPAGYTLITIAGTSTNAVAYEIVTAPSGSYNATWTISAPQYGNTTVTLAAFKSAGGGSPTVNSGFFRFF